MKGSPTYHGHSPQQRSLPWRLSMYERCAIQRIGTILMRFEVVAKLISALMVTRKTYAVKY